MPITRSYSSTDWQLTWNNILIQGFAAEQKFNVTRNSESATMEVGPDGDAVFIAHNDRSGKIEFELQRESPTNALLSAQLVAFEQRPRRAGAGTGAMKIRHTNEPLTSAIATNGVIEKWPDMTAGKKNTTCKWVILLDDVTMFNGGAVA